MRLAKPVARAASTFSLLVLACLALAGPYADLDQALKRARTRSEIDHVLDQSKIDDPPFDDALNNYQQALSKREREEAVAALRDIAAAGARAEAMPTDPGAGELAKRIKSSPLYSDEQLSKSNWWGKAMENFWNWLQKLFEGRETAAPNLKTPSILGPWAIYAMWGILAALVLFLLVLAARHFRWRLNLERKTRALLEEDEPERTLDEWLERANSLEAEGRFREAVRCLYFACLLRFDEARVARFDRGQTNWEHLRRIQQSPGLPPGLEFESATHAFDRIWYGMITNGEPDVRRFRDWYQEVSSALVEKAA